MFFKMFKISFRKMKRSYLLLFLTLFFSVSALSVALLIVRSQKMQEADRILQDYGNYDWAFCEVTEELENQIAGDERFSKLGYVYDIGGFSFQKSGGTVEIGALENKSTEKMYYVNPIMGRYPEKEGEICIDRIALKSSGYPEQLGQKIPMSYMDDDGKRQERTYELVGIIEVQKQEDGVTYTSRTYPEEMYSADNMKTICFPLAYLSIKEAKQFSGAKKHILVDVAPGEGSEQVFSDYIGDDGSGSADLDVIADMHIDTEHIFGREWTALNILGTNLEDGSTPDVLEESFETEHVEEDAYTKYFIPIFMGLILILSSLGIFDAVRLSMEERREAYGILLSMGMAGKRIALHIAFEFFLLLCFSVLLGWGFGVLGYLGILGILQKLFQVTIPSALSLDAYFKPYIVMATRNPWFWSGVIACVTTVAGLLCVLADVLSMTPVRLETSAIHKRKRSGRTGGLYHIVNRYVGRDGRIQRWIPYFMVSILMAVSVFGFLFFRQKAIEDTSEMAERIEDARINGMDYYMKQTNRVFSGNAQYMHQSGVTERMYRELEEDAAVEKASGVIINHSTALIYDKAEEAADILQPQSEYFEPLGNDVGSRLDAAMNLKYFQIMGIDTEKQEVFHVPTVGVRSEDMDYFKDKVIAGKIHPDKLQSGEEAIAAVTDESIASWFKTGKSLPLYDVVRPEKLDNGQEILEGQIPKEYKDEKKSYSVTIDGVTRKYYNYDSLKKCTVRIGAVVCIDTEEDGFFFDSGDGTCQVNLITGAGAFEKWGLPNRNYTSVGVRLKNVEQTGAFEQTWMKLLQKAGYMDSIDAYSILREKDRAMRQIMAVFYAVFGVLLLIGVLCTGNSIAMRIHRMREEQIILYQLGMTKERLLLLYIRRYALMGIVGMAFSFVPAALYSLLVKHILALRKAAVQSDTIDLLIAQKPWVDTLPLYNMLDGSLAAALAVAGITAVILLSALVFLQSGWMKRVLDIRKKEED